MRRWPLLFLLGQLSFTASASEQAALVIQGEYLLRAAGCVSCHTDHDNNGAYLAGGRKLKTAFGTFYTPNITSDPKYGIGGWSEQNLRQALTQGIAPDGSHYYPVFPYTSYTKIQQQDIRAIAAYLQTVKAVAIQNREHELLWYMFRWMMAVWQWLFFEPGEFKPGPDRDQLYNRGAYLVAIGHCTECHTPRDNKGVLDDRRYLAGVKDGPEDEAVPNITPDRKTGIGKWSQGDISYFLKTGELPDGDFSGSLMADVIDDGTRYLTDNDLKSMATYLRSLTPVINKDFVKKKKKKVVDEWE